MTKMSLTPPTQSDQVWSHASPFWRLNMSLDAHSALVLNGACIFGQGGGGMCVMYMNGNKGSVNRIFPTETLASNFRSLVDLRVSSRGFKITHVSHSTLAIDYQSFDWQQFRIRVCALELARPNTKSLLAFDWTRFHWGGRGKATSWALWSRSQMQFQKEL